LKTQELSSPATAPAAAAPTCRFCSAPLSEVFADLGMSPLSNSYLRPEDLPRPEVFYPLCTWVCSECFLVQLPESATPEEIFSDYAYFSSFSDTWLAHAESYVAAMIERFGLGGEHQVVEIASNDGYLLQYFQERGVPVLGVEPAKNVAAAAQAKSIPTLVRFFGAETARDLAAEGRQADLVAANNVLAHTPALNDFVAGLAILLKPTGVATLEFPHLVRLVDENQFDTIYHEHFSYFSFTTVRRVFANHGLELFDVEELPTHGGSLRIYARHADRAGAEPVGPRVADLLAREAAWGVERLDVYRSFTARVRRTKLAFLEVLLAEQRAGRTVVGYGAPAKGNTLLNFCGVRSDLVAYTVDRSPHKQGLFLPGTRIPIHGPDKIRETQPDTVVILPWNLKDEVMRQMADVRSWGGRFAVAVPELTLLP
jgi:SAM-dependent methyltransferase